MDILAGSRDQIFSSQLLRRVYFNCKCAMLSYDFNNTIQTLIMLYVKVLFITLILRSLYWLRFCAVNLVNISGKAFYFLIVSVFGKKLLIEGNFFSSPTGDRTAISKYSSEQRTSCLQSKGSIPSFLYYPKTLNSGAAPEIHPATIRSADKRCTACDSCGGNYPGCVCVGGGGYSTKFYAGRHRPEVGPIPLSF